MTSLLNKKESRLFCFISYKKLPNALFTKRTGEFKKTGAANRIRTGDLILTKDVLCQLSHSSVFLSQDNIIPEKRQAVK